MYSSAHQYLSSSVHNIILSLFNIIFILWNIFQIKFITTKKKNFVSLNNMYLNVCKYKFNFYSHSISYKLEFNHAQLCKPNVLWKHLNFMTIKNNSAESCLFYYCFICKRVRWRLNCIKDFHKYLKLSQPQLKSSFHQ